MALSQVQCLDDNHINVRSSESKPDFFYSEEQRLALETLIQEGRDAFEDYIKTNNIRCFLSDLELERILNNVEVYSPGSPDDNAELHGESDGEDVSLQYWPELSDYSIPQLDMGWPDWVSYRGVTRVHVYTQPPYDGQSHIKEVVVAIVMDLFTDIDIFKDVLDASYRKKVAVYIILERTGVKHFLRMCEKAGMHTGHLKNLRVRSIRGAEFFSRSSKRVCGCQNQKFMFIDGDKAVSGSYSFTWSASRLDRNLITVLTGQAVDIFDRLFQDMYVMSNGVCLSKINLGSEPEPQILPQAVPTVFPTANTALKLINPKYTLVSNCTFTNNGPASNQTNAKNSITKNQKEAVKQIRDVPALPPIHPGLLNLEKANMIHYVPTWPDPEPASDVIGFINIRDTNKPLQAHLMRSELFEVSQAIRFKHSVYEPKKPSSVSTCPISLTPSVPEASAQTCTESQSVSGAAEKHFDQDQLQESSQSKNLILPVQSPQSEMVHVLNGNREDKEAPDVMTKVQDTLQSKNICTDKDSLDSISYCAEGDTVQTIDAPQLLQFQTPTPNSLNVKSPSAVSNKPNCDSFDHPKNISGKQSLNDTIIIDAVTPLLGVNETHQNRYDTQTSKCDSNLSSLSDYYDCISLMADSRFDSEVFETEKLSDLQSSHNQIKNIQQELEFPCLNTYMGQEPTVSDNKQKLFTPKVLKMSCSIIFNFPSSESNTTISPVTTTPVQDGLNDKSALPDKDGDHNYCAQIPNSGFNFSSTSEEYFECSDTMGFGFDGKIKVMEPSSQFSDLNENELRDTVKDNMPDITTQTQKLTEITVQDNDKHSELNCQNIKESDEPNIQSGLEKLSVIEMMVKDHLESDDSEMILGSEDDAQPQIGENIGKHQIQEPEVTQSPVVESDVLNSLPKHKPEMILEVQKKELGAEKTPELDLQPEVNLDLMCEEQSVQIHEKTEKPPKLDLQPEVNLDLMYEGQSVQIDEKTEKPAKLDLQPEVNLDLMCEGKSVQIEEKTEKPPKLDLQPEVNLDLMCEGKSVQIEEKTEKPPKLDLQPEVNLDLMCEGQSVQIDEKTGKPPKLDLQPEVNLDLMCEEQSVQIDEKTGKPPKLDLQPEVNLDLMCEEQSVQIDEKTEKPPKLDLQPEVNLDLMCEEQSVQIHEKTEKTPKLDLQPDVNLDLMCEEQSVQMDEKTEKPPKLDLQSEVNLDLMCEGQSVQMDEKTEKPPKLDLQPEVNLDLMCEEQSVQIDEKTEKPPKLDLQPEVNLDLMCEEQSVQIHEKTEKPPKLDLQPEVNLDLMCEEQSVQIHEKTEKTPKLDLQPDVNLDLMCEEQSVQIDEKTEKPPKLDLQPEVNLDLMCEEQSVQIDEKTEKPPKLDLQPEVNLDLMCEEQSVQIHEKTEKTPKLDLQPDVNLDLMCEEQSEQIDEKTEKPPKLDLQSEVNLDLMCEGQSVQIDEKTEKPPKLDLQPDVNLDLMWEGQSVQIAEKTEKPPKLDLQPEVNLDLMCEEQSVQIDEKTEKPPKLDLQPEVNLDLMCEEQSVQIHEKTEKTPKLDLQPDVNLDLMCEEQSVQIDEKTEKPPKLDLQSEVNLDLMCEGQSVQMDEKTGKPPKLDLQPEVNLDLMCEGQSVQIDEKTEKPPKLDLQPEVNLDLMCEGQSVQIDEKTGKPPKLDLQPEVNLDLTCASIQNSSEVNGYKSKSATDSESVVGLAMLDKADVTPVKPEKKAVTKSIDHRHPSEVQSSLADLHSGSSHPSNPEFADSVNELGQKDGEVSQTVLMHNHKEDNAKENHLKLPEHFKTVDLMIFEDSDLQENEEKKHKRLSSRRTKVVLSTKVSKPEPAGLKTVNVRKPIESKFNLYSKYRKETCHLTAQKKEEGERVSTIQVKKNLPEAKPKLDCQVRKHPHQALPVAKEARGELSKLSITKPHSISRPQRHQASKAETHRYPPVQSNPCITASPCPEKLPTGETAASGSNQTQQRLLCTVHSPNCPTSSPKQPPVQLNGPKSTQSDQHVSRKHSALKPSFTHVSKNKKE